MPIAVTEPVSHDRMLALNLASGCVVNMLALLSRIYTLIHQAEHCVCMCW